MDFEIKRNQLLNEEKKKYIKAELDIAYEFSKLIINEFQDFIKAIVLFGSTARKNNTKGDIDVLIILDDISIEFNKAIVQGYRILTESIVSKVSKRLHITTMRLSNYWEYVRAGDPIAINILREGIGIMDTGIFNPMKILLHQGRIRPSKESVINYISRSELALKSSQHHILAACVDLYWAVIDSAESALMKINEIPPGPAYVYRLIEEKFVRTGIMEKKYSIILQEFYHLNKSILHNEITHISGDQYSKYYINAEEFVKQMKRIIQNEENKK